MTDQGIGSDRGAGLIKRSVRRIVPGMGIRPMPPEGIPDTGAETKTGGAEILVARSLTKVYPDASRPALDGFSISVCEGEIFGLLGPNGAGKTTAISILSSLMRPTGGTVEVCGMDAGRDTRGVRALIGLVPQDIALYPTLTARENLRYFGRLYGLKGRTLEERIAECLALVGLTEKGNQRVSTYSGGMQRRANLAAGLLHAPKLLFLDEPTVGIDPQSRAFILEELSQLRQHGTTMIYTTHYMEEAEGLCTRILVLDEGRTLAQGQPRDLIAAAPGCGNIEDLFFTLTGKRFRD